VHGRVLPFLEQGTIFNSINFTFSYSIPENTTVSRLSLSSFLCPSGIRPEAKTTGTGQFGVANYNWNMGDWCVWGGLGLGAGNRGAFGATRSRRWAEFTDGLSNTIVAAEVKTYQAVLTNCDLPTVFEPGSIPSPAVDPYVAVPEYRSGNC